MVMKTAAAKSEVLTIPAGEFKAKCLQLMDDILEKNLTLIVTKRGKPVMRATAPTEEAAAFRPVWGRTPNIKVPATLKARVDWGDPGSKWKRANKEKSGK
jgi:hypothetical protein